MSSSLRLLCTGIALTVLAFALARCDLLVDLDRGEVDGATPEGCPICTDLTEGGDEEEVAENSDASIEDASADGTSNEMTESGADANLPDAASESTETESVGE